MLRSARFTSIVFALTVVIGTSGAFSPAGAVSATPPHIVATPNNVMVNTKINLVGTGFPARSKLVIKECSTTNWVVVAQHPCDTDNTISVVTDRHGRFASTFKAELCPRSKPGPGPVTQQTCYIGNPQPRGKDTIMLVGAARITVTYP
jgi:hypothetical protein